MQATGTALISWKTVHAYVVLVALRFAGNVDNAVGIVLAHAKIIHTVHILGEIAAIRLRIVLQAIGALAQHRLAAEAEHVLGAGAIVAEGAYTLRGAVGQAAHLGNVHTLLIAGIEVVIVAAGARHSLAS